MKYSIGVSLFFGVAIFIFVAVLHTDARAHAKTKPNFGSVKVPIFVYHHVRPYVPGESRLQDEYDIAPELFEQHLVYLRDHGYTTVTLDDLVVFTQKKTTDPVTKPVILTFDDGWKNQYVYAFPLLKKYGMTATFYVYTDPIGKTQYVTKDRTNPIGKVQYLSWKDIKEMNAAGMTIASHTLSHPHLNRLSVEELAKEIADTKRILEEHLGKQILHFATPFGEINARGIATVRAAGYLTCRTTDDGVFHSVARLLKLRANVITDDFSAFVEVLNE